MNRDQADIASAQLPRVSVVITTRNRPQLVAEAIEAALALDQSRVSLEIIVIDDGSTDETVDVVGRYPVRVISTGGIGMAGARARGLDEATGDFVCWLDDDDVWLPNAISAQLAVFDEHPEYGAVHAQAILVDPELRPFGEAFPPAPLESGWILEQLLGYFPQVGTVLVRSEVARSVGGFDASLPGDNDWDWLLRLSHSYPIGTVAEPVLLFRQRTDPDEALAWRRFPAIRIIFRRHTAHLGVVDRIRLEPILWRHHGWCASVFLNFAQDNWRRGDRRRALRSLGYALRSSVPHTVMESARRAVRAVISSADDATPLASGGQHPDPDDPELPPQPEQEWTPLVARTAKSVSMEAFRASLTLEGGTLRHGVLDDLCVYYSMDEAEAVDRCVNWERWSVQEWLSAPRYDAAGINDFYRTTKSWSFDLLWFAYMQASLITYPVSAAIGDTMESELRPGSQHLDFGSGVGVTSQMFARLGHASDMADVSTSMLEFARFRHERRGDRIGAIDLNVDALDVDRYDVITAIDTLVHIPDLATVLGGLHRALRPDGVLFANFAVRPRTVENAQFLYDDELPLRRLIQRIGFEPEGKLDGMITKYRRVEPVGMRHHMRGARDRVLLSNLRPVARGFRRRLPF